MLTFIKPNKDTVFLDLWKRVQLKNKTIWRLLAKRIPYEVEDSVFRLYARRQLEGCVFTISGKNPTSNKDIVILPQKLVSACEDEYHDSLKPQPEILDFKDYWRKVGLKDEAEKNPLKFFISSAKIDGDGIKKRSKR